MRCASTQEPPPPTGGDLVSLLPLRWLRYGQLAAAGEAADLVRSNPKHPIGRRRPWARSQPGLSPQARRLRSASLPTSATRTATH